MNQLINGETHVNLQAWGDAPSYDIEALQAYAYKSNVQAVSLRFLS